MAFFFFFIFSWLFFFFFFFQAEDGIRDRDVTGVQTCALPISPRGTGPGSRSAAARPPRRARTRPAGGAAAGRRGPGAGPGRGPSASARSEERRVGKECRSRWAGAH